MAVATEFDSDSLSSLEERITRTVELVNRLRAEKEQLAAQLAGMVSERDAAQMETLTAQDEAQRLQQELNDLRSERKQVRTRIEKLLGQMDLLSTAQ